MLQRMLPVRVLVFVAEKSPALMLVMDHRVETSVGAIVWARPMVEQPSLLAKSHRAAIQLAKFSTSHIRKNTTN